MNKPEAYINNWYYNGTYLIGTITNHPHQSSFESDAQMTSIVINFDEPNKIAETTNTIYHLLSKMKMPS